MFRHILLWYWAIHVDLSRQQKTWEEYRKTSWVWVELLDLSRCTSTLLLLLLDNLQTIFRKIDARHAHGLIFLQLILTQFGFIAQSFQKLMSSWIELRLQQDLTLFTILLCLNLSLHRSWDEDGIKSAVSNKMNKSRQTKLLGLDPYLKWCPQHNNTLI